MLKIKRYLVTKGLALVLALLVVFTPFALRVIYAEDPLPTESPSVTESPSSDPTTSPDPSPTATPDEICSPTPSDLPETLSTSSPSPDTVAQSGDVVAVSQVDNSVNTNISEVSPSPSPSPETISNDNEVVASNGVEVDSESGDVSLTGTFGSVDLQSGDALALLNLLNLLNINIVGSDFEIAFINALQSGGQIDLNGEWSQLGETQDIDYSDLLLSIQNNNRAVLVNNIDLNSASGDIQTGAVGSADVSSGDSTALANIANLVNINILGSKFLIAFINVFDPNSGDIILPNPEHFLSGSSVSSLSSPSPSSAPVVFENNNSAVLEGNLDVNAQSGDINLGSVGGDLDAESGDATALANDYSLVNLNLHSNNWFFLLVNKLGKWSGSIIGWQSPAATEKQDQVSQLYSIDPLANSSCSSSSPLPSVSPSAEFTNNNQAYVENDINLNSASGGIQVGGAGGDVQATSGDATAVANLMNMINLNILGGHWFFGVINVLSDWTGNIIFAYPDVMASLSVGESQVSPGGEYEYLLSYKNQGRDEARGASLILELPDGVEYLGNSGGSEPSVSGQDYLWQIGDLQVGDEGFFTVRVKVDPAFAFGDDKVSFWPKLVKEISAASDQRTADITALAKIEIQGQESDNSNNTSSATTEVVDIPVGLGDQRQPVLEITAKNNVNGFVYQGDTVTFDVIVTNKSDVPSYKTFLTQKLYNHVPGDFGTVQINIGTLPAGRSAKVTFGTILTNKEILTADSYYTITQVFGQAENGNSVSSNEVKTYFDIKAKAGLTAGSGGEGEGKEVLGTSIAGPDGGNVGFLSKYEEYLPYILAASVVSSIMMALAKRKINGESLLPVPVIVLNEERRKKLFRNMAVRIAGIASVFFSLFVVLFKYLHLD